MSKAAIPLIHFKRNGAVLCGKLCVGYIRSEIGTGRRAGQRTIWIYEPVASIANLAGCTPEIPFAELGKTTRAPRLGDIKGLFWGASYRYRAALKSLAGKE